MEKLTVNFKCTRFFHLLLIHFALNYKFHQFIEREAGFFVRELIKLALRFAYNRVELQLDFSFFSLWFFVFCWHRKLRNSLVLRFPRFFGLVALWSHHSIDCQLDWMNRDILLISSGCVLFPIEKLEWRVFSLIWESKLPPFFAMFLNLIPLILKWFGYWCLFLTSLF